MKNKKIKFNVLSGEGLDGWVSFDKKTFELLQSANKGLAEELADKDKTIQELKQQLAEKDKEIEYLRERNFYKVSLKDEECLGVYPKNMEKIIRHQVCETIRRKIANIENIKLSSYMTLCEILDQVEGDVK